MSWVQVRDNEYSYLFLRLTPNARNDDIHGVYQDADGNNYLQVSVRAVPENGKVNKAVIAFLAKRLSIAKSDLKLKSGSKSRFKCIEAKLSANLIKREIEQSCN